MADDEGTEESAKRAVVHLKKALEVSKAIGDDEGAAFAKGQHSLCKVKIRRWYRNNEELLRALQELYELRIAELGDENEFAMRRQESC